MINEEIKDERTTDLNTEMAKERTHMAYENNLMAWIRTSLTLIGFGIGVFEVAQKTGGNTIFRSSKLVGLLFVMLGVAATFMAIMDNKQNNELLLHPEITYKRSSSLGRKISYALIIIGVLALINIILNIIKLGI